MNEQSICWTTVPWQWGQAGCLNYQPVRPHPNMVAVTQARWQHFQSSATSDFPCSTPDFRDYLEQCGPQKNASLDTICQNEINSDIASYYLKTSIMIWQDNIMTADSEKIWGLDFLMSLYYSFHFSSNSCLFCYKGIILQPVRNKKHFKKYTIGALHSWFETDPTRVLGHWKRVVLEEGCWEKSQGTNQPHMSLWSVGNKPATFKGEPVMR